MVVKVFWFSDHEKRLRRLVVLAHAGSLITVEVEAGGSPAWTTCKTVGGSWKAELEQCEFKSSLRYIM